MTTYYTVYKTTNKLNGKCYIGTHKTSDLSDGYLGSGTFLKRAIKKHGEENFNKEVLFKYDNPDEMFAKEAELVNEDFLMNENTYNLKVGGFGGFDYINTRVVTEEHKQRRAKNGYKAVGNLSELGNRAKKKVKIVPCTFCLQSFQQNEVGQTFCCKSHAAKYNNAKRKERGYQETPETKAKRIRTMTRNRI